MQITIHSTDKIINLQAAAGVVPARIWEGQTDSGIAVHCFITRIGVNKDADTTQFETELQSCDSPSVDVLNTYFPNGIPLRLVL